MRFLSLLPASLKDDSGCHNEHWECQEDAGLEPEVGRGRIEKGERMGERKSHPRTSLEVPGGSEESPCPEIQTGPLFWRFRGQKMGATGWRGNLQFGIQLLELWLSPELLSTGARGPEKSKLHQEKALKC